MTIENLPVAAAYVEAIEGLQRVLNAEPAPPRDVIRLMDLTIAWMAACALTLDPTIKIHMVTSRADECDAQG
jgi:hypothetical protein